jgi:hypothetical protein
MGGKLMNKINETSKVLCSILGAMLIFLLCNLSGVFLDDTTFLVGLMTFMFLYSILNGESK